MTGDGTDGTGVALLTIGLILVVGIGVASLPVILSPGSTDDSTGGADFRPSFGDRTTPGGPNGSGGNEGVVDNYRRLHEAAIDGTGVRVGVVDVTGFDTADPRFDGQVRAARSFGGDAGFGSGHGTAAAAIVNRVAPDADLYLASFDSPGDFERAVAWLVEQDVDVIVAPVSFFGQDDDGSSAVSRAATRASERGIVFVAPVGNLAGGHWQGRYDDVANGTLQFDDDGESAGVAPDRNYLSGDPGRVTVWLSWEERAAAENYSAVLYRRNGSETELVARSTPYREDDTPNERIDARIGEGEYFVVVRGPPGATGTRVELTSPTHSLLRSTNRGSIAAPATARRVIAVGAYDPSRDAVAAFSSRGPTADGRPGVDVVAPGRFSRGNRTRLVGSSAAAPYVAGVTALYLEVEPSATPGRVEAALEFTAIDLGPPGYDLAAGHGLVAPLRAVGYGTDRSIAANASPNRTAIVAPDRASALRPTGATAPRPPGRDATRRIRTVVRKSRPAFGVSPLESPVYRHEPPRRDRTRGARRPIPAAGNGRPVD